jgi:hypothetical protein
VEICKLLRGLGKIVVTQKVASAGGVITYRVRRGRNGFDGIESRWEGVPGSELPLNDRKNIIANQQFAFAA